MNRAWVGIMKNMIYGQRAMGFLGWIYPLGLACLVHTALHITCIYQYIHITSPGPLAGWLEPGPVYVLAITLHRTDFHND